MTAWRRVLLASPAFDVVSRVMQRGSRQRLFDNGGGAYSGAYGYNWAVTLSKTYTRTRRAEIYYRLLTLTRDVTNDQLLIIGPRDVHELLIAWCYGYTWRNISAIDLYSTHKKIQVMDMEELTLEHMLSLFDAVAMSNTLSYATDVHKALASVASVLKPGGLFAFGQTHIPKGSEWPGNRVSAFEIQSALLGLGMETLYHAKTSKVNKLGLSQTSHDFLCLRELSTS